MTIDPTRRLLALDNMGLSVMIKIVNKLDRVYNGYRAYALYPLYTLSMCHYIIMTHERGYGVLGGGKEGQVECVL